MIIAMSTRSRGGRPTRTLLLVALAVALAPGCRDRAEPAPAGQPAPQPAGRAGLTDLTASLESIRADFNAHRGETRFLTLLAPT
jgi:hypothetical protein